MKIAIIGSGISGLASAWRLGQQGHEITVFEKGPVLGGHAHTLYVDSISSNGAKVTVPVNTAYDVFSPTSYPLYTQLLSELGLETDPCEFSYSYRCLGGPEGQGEWEVSLPFLLNMRNAKQLLDPTHAFFAAFASRCGLKAREYIKNPDSGLTYEAFLRASGMPEKFIDSFFLPAIARPWGIKPRAMRALPAEIVVTWLAQNKTFTPFPVHWRTNRGGAKAYIDRFAKLLAQRGVQLRTESAIQNISREHPGQVSLRFSGDRRELFDHVIVATSAEQALELLADPTPEEQTVIGGFEYQTNHVLVHRDAALMPPTRSKWSYFNICYDPGTDETYNTVWFGKNQDAEVFLTNFRELKTPPAPSQVYGRFSYRQPIFNMRNLRLRETLRQMQGERNTWYAGIYCGGTGHHESGVQSATEICRAILRVRRPERRGALLALAEDAGKSGSLKISTFNGDASRRSRSLVPGRPAQTPAPKF